MRVGRHFGVVRMAEKCGLKVRETGGCGCRKVDRRISPAGLTRIARCGWNGGIGRRKAFRTDAATGRSFPWRGSVRSECEQVLSASGAVSSKERSASAGCRKAGGRAKALRRVQARQRDDRGWGKAAIRMLEPSLPGIGDGPSRGRGRRNDKREPKQAARPGDGSTPECRPPRPDRNVLRR